MNPIMVMVSEGSLHGTPTAVWFTLYNILETSALCCQEADRRYGAGGRDWVHGPGHERRLGLIDRNAMCLDSGSTVTNSRNYTL